MLMTKSRKKEHTIPTRNDYMAPVYHVVIHPCEDTGGYWAECYSLPGCFTDGETIKETEVNMYEAVALFLKDDHPEIQDYSLEFSVADA